jgi:16S rRNA (cytidine1402-2'-O)-methyltransferase
MVESNVAAQPERPALWLVPNTLGFLPENTILADASIRNIHTIKHFLSESRPSAHRLLKWLKHPAADREIYIDLLNKETAPQDIAQLMEPLKKGYPMGVLSEAGMPGIADPGSLAVQWAHHNGFRVIPVTGPSSIFLALAASGLNGQRFSFLGYLPEQPADLKKRLKELERVSIQDRSTQLFIEAPHRNEVTFKTMVETLHPDTKICVAADLTLETEYIRTLSVANWRKTVAPDLKKRPAVFLFLAG